MDREALADECLQIEKRGGSVIEFLKGRGCISPWGTWFRLHKEQLGRKDYQITNGKGRETMGAFPKPILTDDDKKEAVRIALGGESPYEYLRECGVTAPDAAWARIKDYVQKTDPETFAKLPARLPRTEKAKTAAPAQKPPVTLNVVPPEPAEEKAITKPLHYMGYAVTTIENEEVGSFHYDKIHKIIDWESPDRLDCASVSVDLFLRILKQAPTILAILGVNADE